MLSGNDDIARIGHAQAFPRTPSHLNAHSTAIMIFNVTNALTQTIYRAVRGAISLLALATASLFVLVAPDVGAQSAQTGNRVALLIGNATYSGGLTRLTNPPNDVAVLERSLKLLHFTAIKPVLNGDQKAMQRAVRDFGDRARNADMAFFYYSGHGMQSGGENYLLPIGAEINKESDLVVEAVALSNVMRQIEDAKPKVTIMVLDACRDNPLPGRTKSGGKGLARIENAPTNTFIAFAAQPGVTATDDGIYARELASALTSSKNLRQAFDRVGRAVDRATNGKQRPRKDDGLNDDVALGNIGTGGAAVAEAGPVRLAGLEPRREPANVAPPAGLRDGDVFKDCPDCPEMVVIPAGTFMMGSPAGEVGRGENEGPVHRVTLQQFALGKTEVTVGQFRRFVSVTSYKTDAEKNSGGNSGCYAWDASDSKFDWRAGRSWRSLGWAVKDSEPVVCVSFNDAEAYLNWLSSTTNKGYGLPSESQWEYAARAGTTTSRYWGDDPNQACNYANVTDQTTGPNNSSWSIKHECKDGYYFVAPVASYRPNAFGLYDMIGNAMEWTQDCWNKDYSGAPTGGSAWKTGHCARRVLRGGSWNYVPQLTRTAVRDFSSAEDRINDFGFRAGRILP